MPVSALVSAFVPAGSRMDCACCDLDERAFCAGLAQTSSALRAIRHDMRMEAQATVFREGDATDHIFTLVSGAVKLSKLMIDGRRQIVGFLFPGDFFGFGHNGLYGYTAETLSPVTLCRFSLLSLDTVVAGSRELERRLLNRMIAELSFAQEQMLLLGRMSAREKVAHFLLMLSRRATQRGDVPSPLSVPMSRLDIADYLGLTIETVSRTLTGLKKERLITINGNTQVDLLDMQALEQIAAGGCLC
ncbi:helix-turn-helix domain-containing protein [Haematospirillum jordaniae]|uniref:Crp/Fnr family transcriptional regulator n=1 Tax=Haematospirillum jordaniae TaxID=1549855 RepID=A0A143DD78_9PROT|nr:helix-turn-helix domain-containing protein [Haematospirillum jordaniae]AMW34682.1 hypothetical protein AY555_05260 [Haematospirillum jordaniae]NKD44778.1 helix-turn-helix domain-containing protein [Haematospirillum jordaniae]NKD56968.1 helix-turn-helix domain-containing protein [Haematospirillum jordaniae]NKD58876.1 helix-turn-helix domain-containing protein [Haematospirillum jordaniae]NKD66893.1 helix-turn-helix domain-containing protein [Haematospirillum jordaniae]